MLGNEIADLLPSNDTTIYDRIIKISINLLSPLSRIENFAWIGLGASFSRVSLTD